MGPLLARRSTVSGLARGVMDLGPRAAVRSEDEFGELAQDLNHFLDCIVVVVHDLDRILSEVVAVGARLGTLNKHLERQLDGLRDGSLQSLGAGAQRSLDAQVTAAREAGAFDVLLNNLDAVTAAAAAAPPTAQAAALAGPLRDQLTRLRASFDAVHAALRQAAPAVMVADAQSAEYQAFAQSLREMALLEATMQKVAESGQMVLQRLSTGRAAVSTS